MSISRDYTSDVLLFRHGRRLQFSAFRPRTNKIVYPIKLISLLLFYMLINCSQL
ncbi:hypothetical protein Hanom_Chr06g00543741 [Helianthus anomalus]